MPRSSKTRTAVYFPAGLKKLTLAAEAGKKGDYRKAVLLLRELISESDAPPEAWLLLGRSLHALKDYSQALAAFKDFTRQKPGSAEGYLFAGRTYMAVGMPYKAVPLLRKALTKKADPKNTANTKALLGTAYLKSKNSQLAVQTLQEAVEAAPNDKRIYRAYLNSLFVRAIRLNGIEEYELGLQMLRFVLENGPDVGLSESPILRLEMGRAARETGRLEEALEHFTRALNLAGDDRRIRWSRASILMALGKTSEARKEIQKIRSRDAGVPELPWNSELVDLFMIRSFLESGEWRRAAASCRDWLRLRDDRPIIRVFFAEALRNLHKYDTAHNHLLRALDKEPNELEFWYADILVTWEGKDYKSMKKALKAAKALGADNNIIERFSILHETQTSGNTKTNISILQKAIRTLGPEPELMYALGEAYLKTGLLEEAASWFRKTITLKNSHEKAHLGEIAAQEALQIENNNEAVSAKLAALYETYLEKWPDNAAIRRDRAMFLIKSFEFTQAASELEKLLIWEPSNPSLRRVLAYAYRKTGRYREAIVFLKPLLKEKPRDIGLIIEYSGCLERIGAAQYAVAVLEKARDLFQTAKQQSYVANLYLALGVLKARQKEYEKAFDYLREAAALAPKDPRPYEWMELISRKNGSANSDYYEKEAEKRRKFRK